MSVVLDVAQPPTSWLMAAAEENPSKCVMFTCPSRRRPGLKAAAEENISMCVTLDKTQPPTSWFKTAAEENLSICVA